MKYRTHIFIFSSNVKAWSYFKFNIDKLVFINLLRYWERSEAVRNFQNQVSLSTILYLLEQNKTVLKVNFNCCYIWLKNWRLFFEALSKYKEITLHKMCQNTSFLWIFPHYIHIISSFIHCILHPKLDRKMQKTLYNS